MARTKKQKEVTTEVKATDKDTAVVQVSEAPVEGNAAPEAGAVPAEAEGKPAAKRTRKTAEKKAAGATKKEKAAEKTAKDAKTTVTSVYVQYDGRTINPDDVLAAARAAWVAKGHRVSSIKNIELYINVTESKAYPVINGEPQDGLDC